MPRTFFLYVTYCSFYLQCCLCQTEETGELPRPYQVTEINGSNTGGSKDVGNPLTKEDFSRGVQLRQNTSKQEELKNMAKALNQNNGYSDQLEKEMRGKDRALARETRSRWPNGIVPYILADELTEDDKAVIASAVQHIEENSCVTFRQANTDDLDWILIYPSYNGSGCWAYTKFLGPGFGEHKVNLESPGCMYMGVVIHELFHILGFQHEHNRPDRSSMISINWPNIKPDSVDQFFKSSWDTTDLSTVTICNVTDLTQDFDSCVDGAVVTDFGLGYDFTSIMHYGFNFFALNASGSSMIPHDSSITDVGNTVLSNLDIAKLKRGYGCDNLCGGYQRSTVGGVMRGNNSDGHCEWVLEAGAGLGIQIQIMLLSGTDCSEDNLEIREGSTGTGQLVTRFCPNDAQQWVNVTSPLVWVRWNRNGGGNSEVIANWTTFSAEDLCCPKLILEKIDGNPGLQGVFRRFINDSVSYVNGRPVYKQETEDNYMRYITQLGGWAVCIGGIDSNFCGFTNPGQSFCPELVTQPWRYYSGSEWVNDPDGKLRCSDCDLYPDTPECETCCPKLTMSSDFHEFHNSSQFYSQFLTVSITTTGQIHNDKPVYRLGTLNVCVFVNNNFWLVNSCSNLNTNSGYMFAPATECLHQANNWQVYSQTLKELVVDSSLKFLCSVESTTDSSDRETTRSKETTANSTTTDLPQTTETFKTTDMPITTETSTTETSTTETSPAKTSTTEASTTKSSTTEESTTETSTTEASTTETFTTETTTDLPDTTEKFKTTDIPITTETSTTDTSTTETSSEKTSTTEASTTEVSTTESSTTEASTTEISTTEASTTEASTAKASTTEVSTTETSTTETSSTDKFTTEESTTETATTETSLTSKTTTTDSLTNLPSTKPSCMPCKLIQVGSLLEMYFLTDEVTDDVNCLDSCVYSSGMHPEDLFCFGPGPYFPTDCPPSDI